MSPIRACLLAALLVCPSVVMAQGAAAPIVVEPLPIAVVDVRAAWPSLGEDPLTLSHLGITRTNLPGRALSASGGVHLYPIRRGPLKLGVGAELLRGRGRIQPKDTKGLPVGEPIYRRLRSTSLQVSLNFGRGQGWSYVTGGRGPFTLDSYVGEGPGDALSQPTFNVGGGGRWFKWPHLGLNVDIRFYFTRAAERGLVSAGRTNHRIATLSVGATFK